MGVNAQKLQGRWNEVRGKAREKWGELTDDDIAVGEGNIESLIGRIQHKTGEGREVIETFFNNLVETGSSVASRASDAVRSYASEAAEQTRDAYRRTESAVQENPGISIGSAFGLGVLAGVLLTLAARPKY